jgi:hypothetical protein
MQIKQEIIIIWVRIKCYISLTYDIIHLKVQINFRIWILINTNRPIRSLRVWCDIENARKALTLKSFTDGSRFHLSWHLSFTVATMTCLTVTEYLCHKWQRICSVCRYHYPVLSSFMTYHRVCNKSNTTGVNSGAGTEFIPEF